MILANCHCGALRLEVASAPEWVGRCNCSICSRLGALWAYYHPDDVVTDEADKASNIYIWGERCINIHHCPHCGCTTHWTCAGDKKPEKMGVNARMMPDIDVASLPLREIDGASF